MRTADGASAHGVAPLALTLALFVVSYFFVFGVGFAYMLRLVRKGPQKFDLQKPPEGGPGQERTPMRPLSAAEEGGDEGLPLPAGPGGSGT
jgi:cytochrome d ubiquinol oxidase subunit I